MPEDFTSSPLQFFVQNLEAQRQHQRDQEDAEIDRRITLIHDLITGPGANPARTAEGIDNLMQLYNAKAGPRKTKPGVGGFFSGQTEIPTSSLLSGLIHGDIPMEGPTYSSQQQTVQQPGFDRNALSPLAPGSMPIQPTPPQFDGKSILESPVMIPPPPLDAAPTGSPMLNAARQMQTQEMVKTPLPQSQQPLRIAPEELAQREGNAAGIKAGAIADAQRAADIKQWREAGLNDAQIKQMLLRKAIGAGGQMQDADAGFFLVNGQLRRGVRRFAPLTGDITTVDALTGMPFPPDATPAAAPSNAASGSPDEQLIQTRLKMEAQKLGRPLTLDEENKVRTAYANEDANRHRPNNITNMVLPGTDMTGRQAQILNPIISGYRNSAPVKAVSRMAPLEGVVKRIEADPANAFSQLTEIYGFVQALDTYQSTVREGEIALTQQTMSRVENLKNTIARISSARLLSPQAALGIARESRALMQDIRRAATEASRMYRAQAAVNGLDKEWDNFFSQAGIGATPAAPGGGNTALSPGAQAVMDYLSKP